MTFITAFLWGTGLSLGMCVGLVVWSWLRPLFTKRLDDAAFKYNAEVLKLLQDRNRMTVAQVAALERIADDILTKALK